MEFDKEFLRVQSVRKGERAFTEIKFRGKKLLNK